MAEETDGRYQAKKDHCQCCTYEKDQQGAPKAGQDNSENDYPDQLPRIDPVHHRLLFLAAPAF